MNGEHVQAPMWQFQTGDRARSCPFMHEKTWDKS